jgi:hypothetical protein
MGVDRRKRRGQFAAVPYNLLDSHAWRSLPHSSHTLFFLLWRQYQGTNNGNLSVTFTDAKKTGCFRSRATFHKALDALWERGLIDMTRPGDWGTERRCHLARPQWIRRQLPGARPGWCREGGGQGPPDRSRRPGRVHAVLGLLHGERRPGRQFAGPQRQHGPPQEHLGLRGPHRLGGHLHLDCPGRRPRSRSLIALNLDRFEGGRSPGRAVKMPPFWSACCSIIGQFSLTGADRFPVMTL